MPHPRDEQKHHGEDVDNKAQPESLRLQTLAQVAGVRIKVKLALLLILGMRPKVIQSRKLEKEFYSFHQKQIP